MSKKSKVIDFSILSKESFTAFMGMLDKFDKEYYHSSDRKHYNINKQLSITIDKACKDVEFLKIYTFWEQGDKLAIANIEKYLT